MDSLEPDMLSTADYHAADGCVASLGSSAKSLISGRYEVLSVLGSGSSATVVEVLDHRTGRRRALKRLHPDCMSSTSAVMRFEYESALLSVLEHRAIPTVTDRGIHLGSSFMVMSLFERGSALQQGRMAVEQVIELGKQVAVVLAHLHERNIIHRDVTPGNIVQHADGRWALIDYGIAQGPWPIEFNVGSFAFMAPEQRMEQQVDGRADVYGLCSTMYYLCSGENPVDLFLASPSSERFDAVPAVLRDLIIAGTRLDTNVRIGSALSLLDALRQCSSSANN